MNRLNFIAKRLLMLIPLLAGIILVVFLLAKVMPGDPARIAVGLRASPEQVAQARIAMGLDKPVIIQYFIYLGHILTGNFGYSYKSHMPVTTIIGAHVPITLWLLLVGMSFSLLISVPLGMLAALKQDRLVDHIIRGFCVFSLAMPMFWVGIMLITLIALPTGIFPVGGFGSDLLGHVRGVVLPGLTLGIAMAPVMIRSLRATIIKEISSEYVNAAKSLGVSGKRLMVKFILRNALSPVVTLLAYQLSYFLFGDVIVEMTFMLPGMGEGIIDATVQRDLPLVQGYTLIFALSVVLVYLLADIINALLDPRIVIDS